MTETVLLRPPGDESRGGEHEHEPFRPARPSHGIGRRLRQIAGVNEPILDWVPEERPRYTRLGAIVLNTGLMAALSMTALLGTVDVPWPVIVPIALVWGYLILSFDGWLVTSTHGVIGIARLRIFVPRLLISILMGFVIAEPLLLWVFGPAIRTEVHDQRDDAMLRYEARLKECNPVTGTAPPAGCGGFLLNVTGSPQSIREQLDKAIAQRAEIQHAVDSINQELTRREELARLECNGTKRPGTTGIVGEGPNCRRNRTEADRYRASSNIDKHEADLVTINKTIEQLESDEGSASKGYTAAVDAAIAKRVADKRNNQTKIGILDEDRALAALAGRSTFVLVGSWMLRLLLVVVDCLPVLTKLMSRTTTYDALFSRQLGVNGQLHDKWIIEREQCDTGRVDVRMLRDEHLLRAEREGIDEANRLTRANRETSVDEQIEALAARLRQSGSPDDSS